MHKCKCMEHNVRRYLCFDKYSPKIEELDVDNHEYTESESDEFKPYRTRYKQATVHEFLHSVKSRNAIQAAVCIRKS